MELATDARLEAKAAKLVTAIQKRIAAEVILDLQNFIFAHGGWHTNPGVGICDGFMGMYLLAVAMRLCNDGIY